MTDVDSGVPDRHCMPEPIASFFDSVNAHDGQAFRDAFTEDGVVDDWGHRVAGRDGIDAWSAVAFIGSRPTFVAEDVLIADGRVIVDGDWRSGYVSGPSRFDFEITGGKIAKMTISEG